MTAPAPAQRGYFQGLLHRPAWGICHPSQPSTAAHLLWLHHPLEKAPLCSLPSRPSHVSTSLPASEPPCCRGVGGSLASRGALSAPLACNVPSCFSALDSFSWLSPLPVASLRPSPGAPSGHPIYHTAAPPLVSISLKAEPRSSCSRLNAQHLALPLSLVSLHEYLLCE